jgi:transcriptional regulator with XRE-family HTH domain
MAAPRKKSTGATSLTTGPDSADVMKAMRDVLGLSQDRFAAKVGLKQQQISAYENRTHSASLVTLAEIAAKAGVRLEVTVHVPRGAEPGEGAGD